MCIKECLGRIGQSLGISTHPTLKKFQEEVAAGIHNDRFGGKTPYIDNYGRTLRLRIPRQPIPSGKGTVIERSFVAKVGTDGEIQIEREPSRLTDPRYLF